MNKYYSAVEKMKDSMLCERYDLFFFS